MIKLQVDLSAILDLDNNLEERINTALQKAAADMAVQAHAHIVESVQENLHSTREKYLDAMSLQQVGPDTWVIALDKKAMFIEEGLPPGFDMLPGLLNSKKAKMGKNGKYLIVPFEHNKAPSRAARDSKSLTEAVKRELKSRNIPYGKLETDQAGKPKTGLLHSFDVKTPKKTHQGPYQGVGPIGKPKQGHTGKPLLHGVRVYQKEVKDKQGKSSVKKAIMTFRIASESQIGKGMWTHPGIEQHHFFEEAMTWAMGQWEDKIKDQVINAVIVDL
jgi:hypothetical protein